MRHLLFLWITCMGSLTAIATDNSVEERLIDHQISLSNLHQATKDYRKILSVLLDLKDQQIDFFKAIVTARIKRDSELKKTVNGKPQSEILEEYFNTVVFDDITITMWEQFVELYNALNFTEHSRKKWIFFRQRYFEEFPGELGLKSEMLFSPAHFEGMRNIVIYINNINKTFLSSTAFTDDQSPPCHWEKDIRTEVEGFSAAYGRLSTEFSLDKRAHEGCQIGLLFALTSAITSVATLFTSMAILGVGIAECSPAALGLGAGMLGVTTCISCGSAGLVCFYCVPYLYQYYEQTRLQHPNPPGSLQMTQD